MADHSKMKLGRKAIKIDSRTLAFGDYLRPGLPSPPPAADWTKGITAWGMMLNDTLSDCSIAAAAHAVQVWTANTGSMVTVPDATVESYYEQWAGYVAGNPQTDTGGVQLDVLTDWRKQGFVGNALKAFADPKFASLEEIRHSIALFGGVYIGLALPMTAQTQDVWDVVATGGANANPNSWGGHCVFVPKYDEKGFTCITWGQLKTMTLAFWKKYCDEAHTLLGHDWLSAKGAPNGFDRAQLEADLEVIV
ncbi:MAG: hypothetical protein ABSF16_07710 [Terracidiphilus sp.]|jgi:hypothetical protein